MEVVVGFTDVKPEVVLEFEGEELILFCHLRENLSFDHTLLVQRNPFENLDVEEVDSGIDPVTDELLWLFDESFYFLILVCDYDSKPGRVFDL